ncbi:hypothetical protein [Turicimonas muris]|uniref:hypothetical protein n=1 Tax=Turicimonas muris TaxID=1796652 RepID=UPI00249519EA|nr:hypothetical protein [Turicimonas muris]
MSELNEFHELSNLLMTEQIYPRALSLEQSRLLDEDGDPLIANLIRLNSLSQIKEFCLYGFDPFAKEVGMASSPYEISRYYPGIKDFFSSYKRPQSAPSFQSEEEEDYVDVFSLISESQNLLNQLSPSIETWIRADRKGVNLPQLLIDEIKLPKALGSSKIQEKEFFVRFLIRLARAKTQASRWELNEEAESSLERPKQIICFLRDGLNPDYVDSRGHSLLEKALELGDEEAVSWLLDYGAALENGTLLISNIEERLASYSCKWSGTIKQLMQKAVDARKHLKGDSIGNLLVAGIYFGQRKLLEEFLRWGLSTDSHSVLGSSLEELCSISLDKGMEQFLNSFLSTFSLSISEEEKKFRYLTNLLETEQISPRALSLEQTKLVNEQGYSLADQLIRAGKIEVVKDFCKFGLNPFIKVNPKGNRPYAISGCAPEIQAFFDSYTVPATLPVFPSEKEKNYKDVLWYVSECQDFLNQKNPCLDVWIKAERKGVNLLELRIGAKKIEQVLINSNIQDEQFFERFLERLAKAKQPNFSWKNGGGKSLCLDSSQPIRALLSHGLNPDALTSKGQSLLEVALNQKDQGTVSLLLDWGVSLENGHLTISKLEKEICSPRCSWPTSITKIVAEAVEKRKRASEGLLDNTLISSIYFGQKKLLEEYVKCGLPRSAKTLSDTSLDELCSLSLEPKMKEYLEELYAQGHIDPKSSTERTNDLENPEKDNSLGSGELLGDDEEDDEGEDSPYPPGKTPGGKTSEEGSAETAETEPSEEEDEDPVTKMPALPGEPGREEPQDLDVQKIYAEKIKKMCSWPEEFNGIKADYLNWIRRLPLEAEAKVIYGHFINGNEKNCPYPLSKELVIMARMLRQSFLSLISENEPE